MYLVGFRGRRKPITICAKSDAIICEILHTGLRNLKKKLPRKAIVPSHAIVLCQVLGFWYIFVFGSVKEIAVCLTVGADLQY